MEITEKSINVSSLPDISMSIEGLTLGTDLRFGAGREEGLLAVGSLRTYICGMTELSDLILPETQLKSPGMKE
jgi:hypothetical protein